MGASSPTDGKWEPPSVEHLQSLLPQYEISRLLGHGGMGAVYEGVQSNLDRKVAIKILPETLGDAAEGLNFSERFKLEAKSMANLDHPGIISVYDFGQTSEGQLYFVMEFIDGMDIHQYLQHEGGKLPPEHAIAIVAHVLDALGYAHDLGIVHRDIKPANVMIKSDGRVKLADFGLVKRLSATGEGSPDSASLTMTNVAMGTPDFVAPECLEIGRSVDHRADLYAIGVMFYQLLTGAVPRGNFRAPSGRVEGLDPRLDVIVSRAMESDPDHRYQTAAKFRAAIDEILTSPIAEDSHTGPVTPSGKMLITSGPTGRPVHQQPHASAQADSGAGASPVAEPQKKAKRPAVVTGMAVAALLIAGVIGWFLFSGDDGNRSEDGAVADGGVKARPSSTESGSSEASPPPSKTKPAKTTTPGNSNASPKPGPAESKPTINPSPSQLTQIKPPPANSLDLFAKLDLKRDTVRGMFDRRNGVLFAPLILSGVRLNVESVPQEYDLELRLVKRHSVGGVHIVFMAGGVQRMLTVRSTHGGEGIWAFENGPETESSELHRRGDPLETLKDHVIRLEVRNERLTAFLEDREILAWKNPQGKSHLAAGWEESLTEKDAFYLATSGAVTIAGLYLVPLDADADTGLTEKEKPKKPDSPAPTPEDPVAVRLAEIDGQYREFFEKPYADALATLNQQFAGALKREEQAASQTGDLDLVLAFQNEGKQIGNGQGAGPVDAADAPPKLKQWRTTWHTQHQKLLDQQAKNQKEAHARRDRALDSYQQERVKARDIAAAQRVKALREQLAANPEADVATAAIVAVPPGPERSGPLPGNPTLPIITAVPKIEYPPKRPTRVGELIRFSLKEMGEPEVIAKDVVDFRVPRAVPHAAFVLSPTGELKLTEGAETDYPAAREYKTVSPQLSDVVAFDIGHRNWGIALEASGKLTTWGEAKPVVMEAPAKVTELARVVAANDQFGFGVKKSGDIVGWPESADSVFRENDRAIKLYESIGRVADIGVVWINNKVLLIALTPRGRITVEGYGRDRLFEAEDLEMIEEIRDAVAFATVRDFCQPFKYPTTLILLDSGEVVPVGWPQAIFPDGNPLPPNLPKDIESLYVASITVGEDEPESYLGAILSRSQGWIFFGNGFDAEALREKARGCFQIAVDRGNFYGLRDPVKATPPTLKPAPAAATSLPKLPDPPEWLKKGRENGGKVRVWGSFDGEPIDEREFTKILNTDDFVDVMAATPSNVLGVRSDNRGVHVTFRDSDANSERFRDVHSFDRRGGVFLADQQIFVASAQSEVTDGKLMIDKSSIVTGSASGLFYRDSEGSFRIDGRDAGAKPEIYQQLAADMTRDQARLISMGSTISWITGDNRLKTKGLAEGKPMEFIPPEKIVALKMHSTQWLALGESGNVYFRKAKGFAEPMTELSPSRALRTSQDSFASQRPDGTWRVFGPDRELNRFVEKLGPAIDLDLSVSYFKEGQFRRRIVVWIEPVD